MQLRERENNELQALLVATRKDLARSLMPKAPHGPEALSSLASPHWPPGHSHPHAPPETLYHPDPMALAQNTTTPAKPAPGHPQMGFEYHGRPDSLQRRLLPQFTSPSPASSSALAASSPALTAFFTPQGLPSPAPGYADGQAGASAPEPAHVAELRSQLETAQASVVQLQGALTEADRRRLNAEREAQTLHGMVDSTMLMLNQDAQALADTRRALQVYYVVCSLLARLQH